MTIYVTENGWGDQNLTIEEGALNDIDRCNYYREYIGNVSLAVHEDGVDVGGYFAWSLMDNFEWADGYTTRFGLTYVDYETQVRTTKYSFQWLKENVFNLKSLPVDGVFPECTGLVTDTSFPWYGYLSLSIGGILVIVLIIFTCKKCCSPEEK